MPKYAHEIEVCKGKRRKKVEKTIWNPISGIVLLKMIPNFSTFNAILGNCGNGGVCQIGEELIGLWKLLFKTGLGKRKI